MTKLHTIFIMEDEAAIREVVRKYLELDGFKVLEADTGPQALDMLGEQSMDLILLDIMLPGLDGFTITARFAMATTTLPAQVDYPHGISL